MPKKREIWNLQLNMASMKCSYCSKVCETARGINKHLSTCRMRHGTARRTISRQIECETKDFLTIPEVEATLPLTKQIEGIYSIRKMRVHINVERMDPVDTAEYAEKADGKQVNPESVRSNCTRSR